MLEEFWPFDTLCNSTGDSLPYMGQCVITTFAATQMWFGGDIKKHPKVCDGSACVGNTRIPVWMLQQYRRDGASDREIQKMYPFLRKRELRIAWDYVRDNA